MTSVPTGTTQIDQTLLTALLSIGVCDTDAHELARLDAFGGQSAQAWLSGLNAVATIFNHGLVLLDWGTLPAPWDVTGPALASANGTGPHEALIASLATYDCAVQAALISTVGITVQHMVSEDAKKRATPNSQPVTCYLQPIDPALPKILRAVLERKGPKDQRRKQTGELLVDWLAKNGDFVRTIYGNKYYLHRATRRLLSIGTGAWHTWLYRATGVNPASTDFRYLLADCEWAAEDARIVDVVRVAHWDNEQQILRVSRFDGTVYRLDGHTIEEEANGDGVAIFDDALFWQPYTPDYSSHGQTLEWTLNQIPHWEQDTDASSLIFKAWWIASFFTELCPTRPILVAKGEKGSGKSMMLRVLVRMLFGMAVDVSGVPDKADAFTSLVSNSHIAVFDNMDTLTKEIRDKIASLSTGKVDQVRQLYTTNETYTIRYRCWLAITSRTPDTLQRDDLVDRTIILPVYRIEDNDRTRESHFLMEVNRKRNCWWGDVLLVLSSVVASIRRSGIPDRAGFRMEDWAALGTVIASTTNQLDVWEKGLERVRTRQAEFLLEENVVVQAVEAWLKSPALYAPALQATRELYGAAKSALYGVDRPDSNWPKSVRSFARQLASIRRELRTKLANEGIEMSWRLLHGVEGYEFVKIV